jgi:hypothetical protein
MTFRRSLPLLLLLSCAAFTAARAERPCARVPASRAPAHDDAAVTALIAAASVPERTPERGAARDAIFRQAYPVVLDEGLPPSEADAFAMADAARSLACTDGTPRITRALVKGDLAYVEVSGGSGGCTWLLRRDGAGWVALMPLGWTLRGG